MIDLHIIEFAIALIFIVLLLSLFVSWLIDWYASRTNRKGRFLKRMLTIMLGESEGLNWTARLYRHPLIESLSIKYNRITSYIAPRLFAEVLTDLIIEEGKAYSFTQDKKTGKIKYHEKESTDMFSDLKTGIDSLPESDATRNFKLYFEIAKEATEEKTESFISSIESWYNEYMLRVNHTYKRLLRKPLLITGLVIAILFNIDFIKLSSELWTNTHLQKSIVTLAEEFDNKYSNIEEVEVSKEFFKEYKESIGLPIGWNAELKKELKNPKLIKEFEENSGNFFSVIKQVFIYLFSGTNWVWTLLLKLLGFFITALVVSFGAPFWFQALHKIINIKKTVGVK